MMAEGKTLRELGGCKMRASEQAALIGRICFLPVNGGVVHIRVMIKDVKMAYGNVICEVVPMAGVGSMNVNYSKLIEVKD